MNESITCEVHLRLKAINNILAHLAANKLITDVKSNLNGLVQRENHMVEEVNILG